MGTNLVHHVSFREGLEKNLAKIIPLIAHTGKSQQLQHIGSYTESLLLTCARSRCARFSGLSAFVPCKASQHGNTKV